MSTQRLCGDCCRVIGVTKEGRFAHHVVYTVTDVRGGAKCPGAGEFPTTVDPYELTVTITIHAGSQAAADRRAALLLQSASGMGSGARLVSLTQQRSVKTRP